MPSNDTSRALLHNLEKGESRAPDEIFERYVHRLIGLVRRRVSPRLQRRVDAEDVVQSAMRSFFIRAGKGDFVLQRAGDLWRLLATIALNKLRRQIEHHQAAKRSPAKEAHDSATLNQLQQETPSPAEQAALLEAVEQVMQQSSPLQREVLQLRLAGETIDEIAAAVNRSQRTVRRLLQQCRESLEEKASP